MKSLPPSKINSTKLLGGSSFSTKKTSVSLNKLNREGENDFSIIKKQVFQIKNLVTNITLSKKNEEERKRKAQEQENFEGTEKKLEKKKPKETGIKLPSVPKLGFLDRIKNFLFNTFLGFIAVRLIEHLPKLIGVAKFLGGTLDFLTSVGGILLNGLVTFVEKGYEVADFTRKQLRNFGGEGAVEKFDALNKAFENIIFAAIAASLALGNLGSGGEKGGGPGGKPARRGFDTTGRRVGVNTQKRFAEKYGRDEFIKRFGKDNLKNLPKSMQRSALTKFGRKAVVGALGKGGTKTALKVVAPLVRNIPLIGGIMEFVLSWMSGDPVGKAAFKGVGAGLGTWIGGALGSLIPIPGVGTAIGMWLGSAGGSKLGEVIYDKIFNSKDSLQKPQEGIKAKGGGLVPSTRGGKSVSSAPKRTLKKKKKSTRSLSFIPTKIKPGKSTGGEDKIQSVFPNPEKEWWDPLGVFSGKTQEEPQQKKSTEKVSNPQEFLLESNDVLGKSNFFGPFFTLALKSVLGDKPNKLDYLKVGQGLNSWMQGVFKTGPLGFAGGGEVDAKQFFGGEDYTQVIAKSVEDSVSKEIDTTIRNLRDELSLKRPVGKEEMTQENIQKGTEGDGVQVSSDSEDFWLLATASMFENSHPQGSADVAQVIYNRTQYPAWNASTIRKAILNPGQFQPVRQYGGTAAWASIKTKQDALRFSKSHGKTQEQLERVAAALLDKQKQQDAKQFVGPRDSFRSDAYEKANNHLANDTEKSRHGHTFGFEPGGAMIGKFKAGQLSAAQVNASIKGDITQSDSKLGPGSKEWRFGRTGRMSVAPGWSHAHFDAENESSLIRDMIPLLKKMASSGLKPELANGTPILSGKDNEYYSSIVRSGISQHTHRPGPRMDVNMPGFPLIPFPLNYSFYQAGGAGHSAVVPGSGKTLLFHMSKKSDGSAFHGVRFGIAPFDGFMLKLHKGEIYKVVDKDSVDLFGFDLTKEIIDIENKSQLIAKAPSIIEKLKQISGISGYADYENPNQEPQYIFIQSPPEIVYVPTGSGGSPNIFISGGVNSTNNNIEQTLCQIG